MTFQEKIDDAIQKIDFAKREFKPTRTILLFSGGNDSTIVLDACRDCVDCVAHCNTGTGIRDTRDYVHTTVKASGHELIEEFPRECDSYETLVMKYGFPGPAKHIMAYSRLKERALRRVNKRFVKNNRKDRVLYVTGIRADESRKRMSRNRWLERVGSTVWVSPLYHFTRDDMDEYRERKPRTPENPVSRNMHMSGECLCGAFSRHNELQEWEFFYPKETAWIRDLERKAQSSGIKHCKWGGPRKSLPKTIQSPGPLCAGCQYLDEKLADATDQNEDLPDGMDRSEMT